MNKSKSIFEVLGCYILWGVLPVFWKLLKNVNSVYVLAQRVVFVCLFCLLVIAAKHSFGEIKAVFKDKKTLLRYFVCGLLISFNWGIYIYMVVTNRILESSLAYYMNPLLSVLIGSVFFKERLSAIQWVSIGLAFVGVMISALAYGQVPFYGLLMALSFAMYGALKKNLKAESEVSICMETASVLPLALIFIAVSQLGGRVTYDSLSSVEAVALVATGIVTGVPLMLFAEGIKHTPISLSGMLMYINPTLQLLIGVLIYNEAFTKTNGITFAFVWAAVILYVIDSIRKTKKGTV